MLKFLLSRPFLFALPITIVIWWLVPWEFSKFQLKTIEQRAFPEFHKIFYYDLNQDGYSDKMLTNFKSRRPSVVIHNHQEKVIDQWTLTGDWLKKGMQLMFGDFDDDGYGEIYAFTTCNDSVFINGYEPCQKDGLNFQQQYIDMAYSYRGEQDCNFIPGKLSDLNQDGYQEVVFVINAGFTQQPRNVYAYDIMQDTIIKSPRSGAYITSIRFANLDDDQAEEILIDTYAPDNISDPSFPYRDNQAWLMALGHGFNFLFDPIPYEYRFSIGQTWPFLRNDSLLMISSFNHFGDQAVEPEMLLLTTDGQVITRKPLPDQGKNNLMVADEDRRQILKIHRNGAVWELNNQLEMEKAYTTSPTTEQVKLVDADGDGNYELAGINYNQKQFTLYQEDLSHPVTTHFQVGQGVDYYYQLKQNGPDHPQLAFQFGNVHHLFEYRANPWYFFNYVLIAIIYLASSTIIWVFQSNKLAFDKINWPFQKDAPEEAPEKLRINTRTGFLLIDLKDILYCEADGNYTDIHLTNGKKEISTRNLGKIENVLPIEYFKRLNRSIVINTQYLYKVDRKKRVCALHYQGEFFEIPLTERMLKELG